MSMSKLHKAVIRGDLERLQKQIVRLGKEVNVDKKTDAPATEVILKQLAAAAADLQIAIDYMKL